MPNPVNLPARLAALPLEARRIALAQLAYLAKQRKGMAGQPGTCQTCQERINAVVRAIRQDTEIPEEHCPRCDKSWQALEGTIPSSTLGHAVLPALRKWLRFAVAEALQRPLRDLPEDADLARAYAIPRLIQNRGGSEALTNKALLHLLDDKPPHERWEWVERIKILERRLAHRTKHPDTPHYLRWWQEDLVDLANSEVVVALPEVEMLRQSRPELHAFACGLPEAERLIDLTG